MSAFLDMLDELDMCRQDGFIRPALVMALCVPDACRKAVKPNLYYEDWCKQYGGNVLQRFADGLREVRHATVHELRPIANLKFDFSDLARGICPVQTTPVSLPVRYHTINAGALIVDIIGAGFRFYESSDQEVRAVLDRVDDGLIRDRAQLFGFSGSRM